MELSIALPPPIIYQQGFNQLPLRNGYGFIYFFLATGVSVSGAGLLSVYFSFTLDESSKQPAIGVSIYCLLLGIGAIATMPFNPFAYIMFLLAVAQFVPLVTKSESHG